MRRTFVPVEISISKKSTVVVIKFEDGKSFSYPSEYLRVHSTSAEVKTVHGSYNPPAGKRNVCVYDAQVVGNYAVRFFFDDLHESGLYPFEYLYELGVNKFPMMRLYLRTLRKQNKKRERMSRTKKGKD